MHSITLDLRFGAIASWRMYEDLTLCILISFTVAETLMDLVTRSITQSTKTPEMLWFAHFAARRDKPYSNTRAASLDYLCLFWRFCDFWRASAMEVCLVDVPMIGLGWF